MTNYPTQLDEIDQWLAGNFGILPGACSSTENLRYNTAKMIAEALWPDKDHIADDSKKISGDSKNPNGLEKAAEDACKHCKDYGRCFYVDKNRLDACDYLRGFKAGANWQREQDHDACYQCEKAYDNAFFKGEQNAIKMMKEEAIEVSCIGGKEGKEYIVTFVVPYFKIKDYSLGNKAKVYIFRDNKE